VGKDKEGDGGEGGRHEPLPPKCYKTHTGTGGQRRERERDRLIDRQLQNNIRVSRA